MEYRYRVYSNSVELNKASFSPNPLCIEEIIFIIVNSLLVLQNFTTALKSGNIIFTYILSMSR